MESSTAVEGLVPLTLERAKELAAEAVAERGSDYVYTNPFGYKAGTPIDPADDDDIEASFCFYVHDNQPGCIAGYVLHRSGISLDALRGSEHNNALVVARNLGIDAVVGSFLHKAQTWQDKGYSWGHAVEQAGAGFYEPSTHWADGDNE